MPFWAMALLASAVRAQEFQVGRVALGGDEYTLSSDHPARYRPDGKPELPVGSVLSLADRDGRRLDVLLEAPLSLNRTNVHGVWTETLALSGAYRLQFGELYSPLDAATVDFVVAGPDTDGDGIPDDEDACPYDNPRGRDADLDGCPDTVDRLSASIARLRLDPAIEEDLLYASERARLAAEKRDKEEARSWLRELGARASAARGLEARQRQMLRDLAANALSLL